MRSCCVPNYAGGGTAGNVTRLQREQIESIPPTPTAPADACERCEPRAAYFQQTRQSHTLLAVSRRTRCHVVIHPSGQKTNPCADTSAPSAMLGSGSGFSAERTHTRVSRIQDIAPVTHRSSGLTTARVRDAIQNASAVRGAEFIRRRAPPPPCPVYSTAPQPGVPIAPNTPCNPGTQRVDYESPWR
jgi:hypothetical protein